MNLVRHGIGTTFKTNRVFEFHSLFQLKDVRANCLCASLLRTQFMSCRNAMLRHARARAQRKKSIHIKGWYPLC